MSQKQFIGQVGSWLGIVLLLGVGWWVTKNYEVAVLWVEKAGWWGAVVAVGLYALFSLTPVPTDPLTLLCGALYGWVWGFFISWTGNNAAAMVEYFIFRKAGQVAQFDEAKKKMPGWLMKMPVTSLWFLIGVRMIPGFGGKLVGVMAGVWKVGWRRFLWTAMVANSVGSLLYALGGWTLIRLLYSH